MWKEDVLPKSGQYHIELTASVSPHGTRRIAAPLWSDQLKISSHRVLRNVWHHPLIWRNKNIAVLLIQCWASVDSEEFLSPTQKALWFGYRVPIASILVQSPHRRTHKRSVFNCWFFVQMVVLKGFITWSMFLSFLTSLISRWNP